MQVKLAILYADTQISGSTCNYNTAACKKYMWSHQCTQVPCSGAMYTLIDCSITCAVGSLLLNQASRIVAWNKGPPHRYNISAMFATQLLMSASAFNSSSPLGFSLSPAWAVETDVLICCKCCHKKLACASILGHVCLMTSRKACKATKHVA